VTEQPDTQQPPAAPRWQPLSAIDRRVAGVLVEKAKTTPNAYPITLNAAVTGCNQKSNRWPVMNLEPADVEESLDRLREFGAVGLIQGQGRVSKYRHYLYQWLGVEKVELAIMAELLLRGPQTEGELRGRASRMEPIQDLPALRPLLASLKAKRLVIPLTPEGRGHVVTHALYSPRELERILAEYASGQGLPDGGGDDDERDEPSPAQPAPRAACQPALEEAGVGNPPTTPFEGGSTTERLRREVEDLRGQVAQLRSELDDLAAVCHQTAEELQRLRDDLGN
jgi:uncharacterized protein YceH (UPF0502 family)